MLKNIILGGAQLGMNYGINNHPTLNKKEVFEILRFAVSNGISIIDTAEIYGESMELIGEFIKENPNNLEIISKLDPGLNFQNINLKKHIQNKLNVVGLRSFYGYMFHSYKCLKGNDMCFKQLVDIRDSGLINKIGISLYETNNIIDIIQNYNFDFIQIPFNLLDNEKDKVEILKIAKKKKIKVHVRSVFLQGLFFKSFDHFNKKLHPLKKYIGRLNEISSASKIDIESLALRYPLKKDYIDKVIFGVHNLQQFSKNIKIINSDISIPDDQIEKIIVKEKELLKPYNWK